VAETDTPRRGFISTIRSYPASFWVANTMEIFERMSWYGWFTVSALYITGSPETGGLGFSSEVRGNLQAIVPFFLYLLPVFTGALADRYGYKRMFTAAYIVMIAAYYLLGQFTSLPAFFMAFMFVAVGAAMFKPVVVGTIARVTDGSNSATGFGVFYMMVNIGGFVGPIVAGVVRGMSWEYVFIACSFWAFINLLIVTFFYKDPTSEAGSTSARTFSKVMDDLVEVLGNLRFFIAVFAVLFALMFANTGWISWTECLVFCILWLIGNFAYDRFLPRESGKPAQPGEPRRNPLVKRMYCSNWRFALFLLIMSGFWTSFNQIFYTMPEYIRDFDFTETSSLVRTTEDVYDASLGRVFGKTTRNDPDKGVASKVATINPSERAVILAELTDLQQTVQRGQVLDEATLEEASHELLGSKVRLSPAEIDELVRADGRTPDQLTDQAIIRGRQFNPEFIVNFDAGAIVLFQVLVSFLMVRFRRFTTMIVGMVVAAVGIGLSGFAGDTTMIGVGGVVWIVALGIVIFAFGEMMASPTSQEYVARIAPRDKTALYMGYYFVAVALGNLFGGILSGQLYGKLARDMQRPDLMWLAFGGIMLATAFVFLLYNRFVLPKEAADSLIPNESA